MRLIYYIILSAMFLGGCTTTYLERPPLENPQKIRIPTELKADCEDIPLIKDETMGELLLHDTELIILYSECRLKHKQLIEAIEKAL
jgi:PBP1b-binding outer membrane lipoprotein LpoB